MPCRGLGGRGKGVGGGVGTNESLVEDCGFSPSIATTKIAGGPNCNLRQPQLSISDLLLGNLGYAPTCRRGTARSLAKGYCIGPC